MLLLFIGCYLGASYKVGTQLVLNTYLLDAMGLQTGGHKGVGQLYKILLTGFRLCQGMPTRTRNCALYLEIRREGEERNGKEREEKRGKGRGRKGMEEKCFIWR